MIAHEIWLAYLPEKGGHEQKGKRPVLILNQSKHLATVIPFTTNTNLFIGTNSVDVMPTIENGLTEISLGLIFQITSIDKSKLIARLGVLESEKLEEIKNAAREYLKL